MRRGFTLLEILLALAVIALLTTVLVGTSASLLKDRAASPDDVFWKACQAARKSAVKTGNQEILNFDDKAKAFVVDDGTSAQTFPIPQATQDLVVTFLSVQTGSSAILLGGVAIETGPPPTVTFFADGTCSPFRVQFRTVNGAHVLSIDPWTCAQTLTPKDAL